MINQWLASGYHWTVQLWQSNSKKSSKKKSDQIFSCLFQASINWVSTSKSPTPSYFSLEPLEEQTQISHSIYVWMVKKMRLCWNKAASNVFGVLKTENTMCTPFHLCVWYFFFWRKNYIFQCEKAREIFPKVPITVITVARKTRWS